MSATNGMKCPFWIDGLEHERGELDTCEYCAATLRAQLAAVTAERDALQERLDTSWAREDKSGLALIEKSTELSHLRGVLDAARVLAKRANASGAWSVINELTMILDNANEGDGK